MLQQHVGTSTVREHFMYCGEHLPPLASCAEIVPGHVAGSAHAQLLEVFLDDFLD